MSRSDPTQWMIDNGEKLDQVAEQHDHLGTMQGVMHYPGACLEVVFDHGIVVVDRQDASRVLAVRQMTRFDELTPAVPSGE